MADALAHILKDQIALLPDLSRLERPCTQWLFPGRPIYQPLSAPTSHHLVAQAFKDAGIGGHRPGLHRLRKSWATNMLAKVDIGVLMKVGGWNTLATVQRYLASDDEAARAAIDALDF